MVQDNSFMLPMPQVSAHLNRKATHRKLQRNSSNLSVLTASRLQNAPAYKTSTDAWHACVHDTAVPAALAVNQDCCKHAHVTMAKEICPCQKNNQVPAGADTECSKLAFPQPTRATNHHTQHAAAADSRESRTAIHSSHPVAHILMLPDT